MKKRMKKYPIFRTVTRSTIRFVRRVKNNVKIVRLEPIVRKMQENSDFPASDGTSIQHLNLTLKGNRESIHLINRLLNVSELEPVTVKRSQEISDEEDRLLRLFDSHGSDKGERHGYYRIYHQLLSVAAGPVTILEIGIGSNDRKIPSNMGRYASPGASLRAFRDFKKGTTVFGADIDSKILNSDLDIICYHLDQTSDKSWLSLTEKISPKSLDLLIDDGLHSPMANLRTLIYGPKLLKSNGCIVIEDIAENAIPLWNLVAHLSREKWKFTLYRCFKSYALLVENPK